MKATNVLLSILLVASTAACGAEEGERRSEKAYWDEGPPPVLRFEGEEVYWKGDWVTDGPVTYFDKTGRVTARGHFKLGKEDGDWTMEEGNTIGQGRFQEGRREGRWEYRYASDQLQEEGSYRAGQRDGEWRTYYSNGALETITQYENGQIVGEVQRFDYEGNRL